jgi:hypothetical protein
MVQARSDLAPVENLRVRAHVENGIVELRDFAGSYHGATVTATGQAPVALLTGDGATDGSAVLKATALGVTSAVLSPFLDPSTISQVAGSLDARLDLSSPSLDLNDVQGEVVIDRLNLTVADLPVMQRMPTRVVARDGIARIESWTWESEGTSVDVSGQVRLSDQQAAILANGKLDARLLTPFLGVSGISTAGQVDTRISVTGALTEPTINGEVRLANGELRLREPRVVASELNAVAVLARSNAFITSLSGTVNGGKLSGSGQVQYAPELRGQFMANVSGMAMNFPEGLRTEVDSSIEFTTTVDDGTQANRVSGLVTIKRGAYREPLALVTGLLSNLQRTGTTTGSPPSPFLQSLALDVRVITDEDVLIDNNVAKAQLGADLRLINVAASPALSGRLELREGGQLFLGRNVYVVQNGTIDFANPSTIEPILGIEASTRVSGNDIDIRLTGNMEKFIWSFDDRKYSEQSEVNFTEGDTYRLNNNAIKIVSHQLAQNYTAEFEKMFVQRSFGPSKPAGGTEALLTLQGVPIENYFAPEDGVADKITARLAQAKQSIHFLAFSFTSDPIGSAMLARAKAGVSVAGVFEKTGSETQFSEYSKMRQAKLDVLQDGNPYVMHHKVIIIDGRTVIFGSFNFSNNADKDNDENLLIIDDPTLAQAFEAEFQRVREVALNPLKK